MSQKLPQKIFVQKIQKIKEIVSDFFLKNILGILTLGIMAGVIAAYLYEYRERLWNEVTSLLPFIIALCLVMAVWWWNNRTLRTKLSETQADLANKDLALTNMSDALSFDSILLLLLAEFVSVPRTQQIHKLKEILQELLDNAILAQVGHDDSLRACVFLPTDNVLNQLLSDASSAGGNALSSSQNHEEDDYITISVHISLDTKSAKNAKCYIGNKTDIQRGLAGMAFIENTLLVAHIVEKDGKGICKEYPSAYRQFENHYVSRYKALAAVPIVTLGRTKKPVGVICFDSKNETLFDDEEARKALVTVSTRIGAMFSIYGQMVSAGPSQAVITSPV